MSFSQTANRSAAQLLGVRVDEVPGMALSRYIEDFDLPELVRANNLQAKPAQLQAHIEELSQSYEQPQQVVAWYMSDRQRMAEVEAVVIEANVAEFILSKAKISDKSLGFEELMGQQGA